MTTARRLKDKGVGARASVEQIVLLQLALVQNNKKKSLSERGQPSLGLE